MQLKPFYYLIPILIFLMFLFLNTKAKEQIIPLIGVSEDKISGMAVLKEINGTLVVNIGIEDREEVKEEGAFIQKGTCSNPQDVVYYLTKLYGGKSSSTTGLKMSDVLAQAPLIIAVYDSLDAEGELLFCGELNGKI